MDGPSHELLARAALASDHRRGGAVRDLADRVEDLRDPAALADDVLEAVLRLELAAEVEVLVPEPFPLERVANDQVDFVELERLGDVVVGAEFHRLDRRLRRRDRGDDDDGGVGGDLLGGAEYLHPVHLRHSEIRDDDIHGLAVERLDGRLAARRRQDVVPLLLQRDGEEIPHALLIVDYEDAGLGHDSSMLHRAVGGRKS